MKALDSKSSRQVVPVSWVQIPPSPPKSIVFKLIEVRIKFSGIVRKFNRKIFLTLTVIRVIIY